MMNYSLFKNQSREIGLIAKTRFEGYEEDDSRFLQDMDERKWTLELGSYASKDFIFGNINIDFSADILNRHQGYELKCYYSYNFRNFFKNPAFIISPNIGVNYRSKQLNNYYYGVHSSEVIQGPPEYSAGDSIGLITGIRINYMHNENINLMDLISFEWLADEVKNSPIIDNDFGESFILGIMYKF